MSGKAAEAGLGKTQFKAGASPKIFLGLSVIGLVFCVIGLLQDHHRFAFSYLTSFAFFLCLSLGALWFVLLQHLTRAGWSVVVRRIAENISGNLIWGWVLAIPLVYFALDGSLFHWTHQEVQSDAIYQAKSGYLNMPFLLIRMILFFALWSLIARWFLKISIQQDSSGDKSLTLNMQKWSTVAVIAYGLTETFFAFDWIMSLNYHWFSTMFGVYYFACSAIGIFSLLILVVMALRSKGYLKGIVTVEHDHDLGKLLFGFNVFWTYIAFSQFFLIWYANLGEETIFYHERSVGSWKTLSIALPIIHFVIPFFFLISRVVKRNNFGMALGALWLFVVNYIDIYWLIMPNIDRQGALFNLGDMGAILFIGGLFFHGLIKRLEKSSLIPEKDPRLSESLHFENA